MQTNPTPAAYPADLIPAKIGIMVIPHSAMPPDIDPMHLLRSLGQPGELTVLVPVRDEYLDLAVLITKAVASELDQEGATDTGRICQTVETLLHAGESDRLFIGYSSHGDHDPLAERQEAVAKAMIDSILALSGQRQARDQREMAENDARNSQIDMTGANTPRPSLLETCPDFPQPCQCPTSASKEHLRLHVTPCGHCKTGKVQVPTISPAGTRLSPAEIVMAGGGYCRRCRANLCPACASAGPAQSMTDCITRN